MVIIVLFYILKNFTFESKISMFENLSKIFNFVTAKIQRIFARHKNHRFLRIERFLNIQKFAIIQAIYSLGGIKPVEILKLQAY